MRTAHKTGEKSPVQISVALFQVILDRIFLFFHDCFTYVFDLFNSGDRGTSHAELNWPIRLRIIRGVARGMGFLHSEFASYEVPHGNLKSSNILLSSDYEPLLTDYAFFPLISNTQTAQSLFAYKSPEAILYQQLSPKSDVYCLGIIILEILTGKFPSQYLNNQKGGTDLVQWVRSAIDEKREADLIDPEIANSTGSLAQMEMLLHIGAACTEGEQDKRLDMREAVRRIEELQVLWNIKCSQMVD